MRWVQAPLPWIMLSLVVAAGLLAGNPSKEADPNRIPALIQQLGDARFARRQQAGRELADIGETALPAVRKAATSSADYEVRTRAEQTIRAIMLGARKSKSIGLETSLIDVGGFQMGSQRTETGRRADESPRQVRITKPFLMGTFEVTQEEFEKVMKHNPSWFAKTGGGQAKVANMDTSRFPVEQVTWFDAIEFCNQLSKLDGYEPYYKLTDVKREENAIKGARVTVVGSNGYRLPTEAEWEYACRAQTNTAFHFGHANSGKEANLKPGPPTGYGGGPTWPVFERTTKVGSYPPNGWGLHDMHGNAGEWCWDWYEKEYPGDTAIDPKGPDTGVHRVMRSGSWLVNERSCRSASRYWHTPDHLTYIGGFRVARSP